ncbi:LysR family transcriptional regulator [Nonomuraea pusilla]|uniref:DNA-binding transcriptional regulator, LysR family n=1 Tax=Nonomuraea pusilla TaxID=46177 RepID=A0A1H7XUG6_9ACTN|nr:LysR family transcriptional regulator [Nonomuraea pusilla]SEM36788.1 DNA-binding transcriptional regulator, LysR family [Nonomuraea pusilla]
MQLELRHLRTLRAIADHGSVTKAAAALGVSQPALTAQLRRIERLLGGAVFTRDHRGVAVTAFGEFVLARTRVVLAGVDDLLAAGPYELAGQAVRVGSFENPVVVTLVANLARALPESRVTLQTEHFVRVLVDMVANGRLDVALVADYPGHELRPHPSRGLGVVAVEPVFVALPAAHPLARREEVELADLAGEPWVLPPPDGMGWPDHLLEACARAGFTPRGRYQLVEAGVRKELIGAGHAVSACQALHDPGERVAVLPLRGNPLWMRLLLIWRPSFAPHAPALLESARAAHAAVAARSPSYTAWTALHGRPPLPS